MDFFSSLLSDDNSSGSHSTNFFGPDSTSTSFGGTGGDSASAPPRNQKHLGDAANKNTNSNSNGSASLSAEDSDGTSHQGGGDSLSVGFSAGLGSLTNVFQQGSLLGAMAADLKAFAVETDRK